MLAVLLASAILSSGAAAEEPVIVHEWGVVRYAGESAVATGTPGWSPYGSICVDAPVIMFHGAPFTGSVTVCSLGGFTSVYPEPDVSGGPGMGLGAGLGSMIRWEGLSVSSGSVDDIPVDRDRSAAFDFYWAMDGWRLPGSSMVSRSSDSFSDSFLYYEVDLSEPGFPVPLAGYCAEGTSAEEIAGEMLLFVRGVDGTITLSLDIPEGLDMFMDESVPLLSDSRVCDDAFGAVSRWAGDRLSPGEVRSMWATWEPYILYGDWEGSTLAVFPIPQPLLERISSLYVYPDGSQEVRVDRFFLGMMPI